MKQLAENLREQQYINGDNVEAIRKYIRLKNPSCSEEELSVVFADALHKILDARICQFGEEHRKEIKAAVINRAVKKREFSINAAEVLSSCLALKLREDSYKNSLTHWLNQSQSVLVSMDLVDMLLSKVETVEVEYLENNLEEMLEEFEARVDEPETIIEEIKSKAQEEAVVLTAQNNNVDSEITVEYKWFDKLKDFCRNNVEPALKPALSVALPLFAITVVAFTYLHGENRIQPLQNKGQGRYANVAEDQMDRYLSLESRVMNKLGGLTGETELVLLDGLHGELRYEVVDEGKLKTWLHKRNSILVEEPYFSAIIGASKKYDINPLLMFAITGQEQSFVPRSSAAAKKIANNPFNVYGSWEKYNTNISDSSNLAADTIIQASRNRPAYVNTISWINRRYAEDPNWGSGVSEFVVKMRNEITDKN